MVHCEICGLMFSKALSSICPPYLNMKATVLLTPPWTIMKFMSIGFGSKPQIRKRLGFGGPFVTCN